MGNVFWWDELKDKNQGITMDFMNRITAPVVGWPGQKLLPRTILGRQSRH